MRVPERIGFVRLAKKNQSKYPDGAAAGDLGGRRVSTLSTG